MTRVTRSLADLTRRLTVVVGVVAMGVPSLAVGQTSRASTAQRDDCGIALRAREVCSADGRVVVRVVDSVHVLVAVARRGTGASAARTDTVEHLFLYTAALPVTSVASRTIDAGHVEYREGELYVSGGGAAERAATDLPFALSGPPRWDCPTALAMDSHWPRSRASAPRQAVFRPRTRTAAAERASA